MNDAKQSRYLRSERSAYARQQSQTWHNDARIMTKRGDTRPERPGATRADSCEAAEPRDQRHERVSSMKRLTGQMSVGRGVPFGLDLLTVLQ